MIIIFSQDKRLLVRQSATEAKSNLCTNLSEEEIWIAYQCKVVEHYNLEVCLFNIYKLRFRISQEGINDYNRLSKSTIY